MQARFQRSVVRDEANPLSRDRLRVRSAAFGSLRHGGSNNELPSRSDSRSLPAGGCRAGKAVRPRARCEPVQAMREIRAKTEFSGCRAGALIGVSRTLLRHERRRNRDVGVLGNRILPLAVHRRQFGYRRPHALFRREGLVVNCDRWQRI